MSNALNLIIARGFASPVQGFMDSYNNQKDTVQRREANDVSIQNAQQDQQFQVEDRQRQQAAGQAQQAKLAELSARVERLHQMDPNSPEAQQEARSIAADLAMAQGDASAFQSIMLPKPAATGAKFGAVSPSDYTPESLDRFSKTGNYGDLVRQYAPTNPPAPPKPRNPPNGYVWVDESNPSAGVKKLPGFNEGPAISPKDAQTVRNKLLAIREARRQVAAIREKFKGLSGTYSAGLGGGYLPTEVGRSFDAAVDQARNSLTSITRVPGVGAMSDFETRLQQAAFPTRNDYESVTEQKISGLEEMLKNLEAGYSDMIGGSVSGQSGQSAPTEQGATSVLDFKDLPD